MTTAAPPEGADRWPDFRGPAGDGHGAATGLPRTWSATTNVRWRTPIHDAGWSSPVVWGKRIWCTTATERGHEQFVVCIDRDTGKVLLDRKLFHNPDPERIGAQGNTYASPSPVVDRERAYLHFGTYGTACVDTRTLQTLWTRRDLNCLHFQGPGSSPVLVDNRLICTYDGADAQYLVALDPRSGKTLWRTERGVDWSADRNGAKDDPDQRKAFSTPYLLRVGGRTELVSVGARLFAAYDPRTGRELWRLPHPGFSNASRPVAGGGLLFLNTGFNRPELWAVRADRPTEVVWRHTRSVPTMSSPILVGGLLFFAADSDFVTCLDAATGAEVWKERIGGRHYASPVLADGALYLLADNGRALALAPERRFRVLGEAQLPEGSRATPAVADNSLFIRTYDALYRIAT